MKILPDSVIGNIQEFDSCVTGSIPVPVADVVFSLFGKATHCECEEQGSPALGGTETTKDGL